MGIDVGIIIGISSQLIIIQPLMGELTLQPWSTSKYSKLLSGDAHSGNHRTGNATNIPPPGPIAVLLVVAWFPRRWKTGGPILTFCNGQEQEWKAILDQNKQVLNKLEKKCWDWSSIVIYALKSYTQLVKLWPAKIKFRAFRVSWFKVFKDIAWLWVSWYTGCPRACFFPTQTKCFDNVVVE